MVVELLSVGTELLLGNIINTNAAYLAKECALLGFSCFYQSVVGDNEKRLLESIETAMERSDILILTGGLGPTGDDITKECSAKVFGKKLIFHEHSWNKIEDYFKVRNLPLTENNRKQALIPEGAVVVDNENGTAPGIIMEKEGKHILLLPGPPLELKPMFEGQMKQYLMGLGEGIIYSKVIKLCSIGESEAETKVYDLIKTQANPTIAPYAKTGEVHFRVTAKAADEKEAMNLLEPVIEKFKKRFGEKIYTVEEAVTLETVLLNMMERKGLSLGIAESCTGGLVAARFTNINGASKVFHTGVVTYSNEAKMKLLDVSSDTLEKYGAVSENTALEMVSGMTNKYGTDVALSITGIAGPTGGSDEKPVGLVYIACRIFEKSYVKKYNFKGNREKIRESAVVQALVLLRESLLKCGYEAGIEC